MRLPVRSRSGTRARDTRVRAARGERGRRRSLPRPPPEPLFHLRRAPGQRQVVHEHDAVQVVVERPALGLVVLPAVEVPQLHEARSVRVRARVEGVDEAHARVDAGCALDARVGRVPGQHARQRGLAAPVSPTMATRTWRTRSGASEEAILPLGLRTRRGRATPPEPRLVARLFVFRKRRKRRHRSRATTTHNRGAGVPGSAPW